MTTAIEYASTNQCLRLVAAKNSIGSSFATALAKEDVPFEKRSCKELTSLLRRNPENLSELILFFDTLYKYACDINTASAQKVETSALFNFIFMQFTKSDFWSAGPLKIHSGFVSKFPQKTDSELHVLIVELLRIKTELEMFMSGSLSARCVEKFDNVLQSNKNSTVDETEDLLNLKELTMKKFMEISDQREDVKTLRVPSTCCDCSEAPVFYCKECNLYRCQLCFQKSHKDVKMGHKEVKVNSMNTGLNTDVKMNDSFNAAIAAEQNLALVINKDSPWNELTIRQQSKELAGNSEQLQKFRNLILNEKGDLLKGVNDDEISSSFQLSDGDANKALQILKERRKKALNMLGETNLRGNHQDKLANAHGNVAKVLTNLNKNKLESEKFQFGHGLLVKALNDTKRDKLTRQRLAFANRFFESRNGWEMSIFLIDVLDHGNKVAKNPAMGDGESDWWNDFFTISHDDLVEAILGLKKLTFEDLLESEKLSAECIICSEKVNKKAMYYYTCKCSPTCNGCLMANLGHNFSGGRSQLKCFKDCFKDNEAAAENERTLMYCHIQDLARKCESYKNVFDKFESVVANKAVEGFTDTFRCPHPNCENVWILNADSGKMKRRVRCPECGKTSCRKCGLIWLKEHRNDSCDNYKKWLSRNRPDVLPFSIAAENEGQDKFTKIKCPKCGMMYMLDRGGCLHFVCNECHFEFCGFCSKPFHKPSKNPCPTCIVGKGLHAHHPRNCPFYTRDYPVELLKELVEKSGCEVDKILPKNKAESEKCEIIETDDDRVETKCDEDQQDDFQGYCKKHFVELLCGEIFVNKDIDPVEIMTLPQLRVTCDRENLEYDDKETIDELKEIIKRDCSLHDD